MMIAAQKVQGVLVSTGELKLRTARMCTERLDETKWSETRDETPSTFVPRPDPRRTVPRPRRDRDKTSRLIETTSLLS